MNAQQIISDVRDKTNTTTSQIGDNDMVFQLNESYKRVWAQVVNLDRSYGRGKWTTNVIADVNQYDLKPVVNGGSPEYGQYRIEKMSLKYQSSDTFFTKCLKSDRDQLTLDSSWYEKRQSKIKPFFIFGGNSVFIFPTPTAAVSNGLVLEGPKKPYDLVINSPESAILVPEERHYVIALSLKVYVFTKRMMINEKNDAIAEYKDAIEEMKASLSRRETSPVELQMDSLEAYEY